MNGSFLDKIYLCGEVWKAVLQVMWRKPGIFIPFCIVVLIELVFLTILFFAPHHGIISILGPPIRKFFGEIFLHYPYNLSLIPTMFEYINLPFTILVTPLVCGITVGMVALGFNNKNTEFGKNLRIALSRYFSLLFLWVIVGIIYACIFQLFKFLSLNCYPESVEKFLHIPGWRMFRICQYISLLICLLIEPLVSYVIPLLILEKKKLFASIKEGAIIGWSIYMSTFILITIPTLLGVCLVLVKQKLLSVLMDKFYPEIVLVIMACGFILILFVEVLKISSLTKLFLLNREYEKEEIESIKKEVES
jgi:hypothetical protein